MDPQQRNARIEELVGRYKTGELELASLMRELYPHITPSIRRLCAGIVSHPDDVDDATQEVVVAVFRGLPKFRQESKFTTWLHRVTLRIAARQRSRNRPVQPLPAEPPAGDRGSPELESQAKHQLRSALATLTLNQRSVILLASVEGLSRGEIAAVLGVPEGTVWSRLHAARRELARALLVE